MMQTQLETELFDLAKTVGAFDPLAAERLNSLGQAVIPNAPAGAWLGMDLYKAIDLTGIIAAIRDTHLVDQGLGRLEQLRNFLALLPVLLTWIGLMFAGTGYRDAVQADPSLLNRPFLLLWEEGFQGHGPAFVAWLTLSNIAFIDMLIIGAMLAITWRIHGELNVKQARRETQAAALEQRLHHATWTASLVLAEKNAHSTIEERFTEAASGLLDELRAERIRLGQLADEREHDIVSLRDFTGGITTLTADLVHSSETTQRSLAILGKTFSTVEMHMTKLTHSQANLEQALLHTSAELVGIGNAHVAMLNQFDATSRLLEESAQQSTKSTIGVGTAIGQLRAEMLDFRRQLLDERNAYQQTAQSTEYAARTLSTALQATSTGAQELGDAARTMQDLLVPFSRIPEQLGLAANEQTAAANILNAASSQIAQSILGVNHHLHHAAQTLDHTAMSINDLKPQIESLVSVHTSLVDQVGKAATNFPTTNLLVEAWNTTQTKWVDALIRTQQGRNPHRRWWQRKARGA